MLKLSEIRRFFNNSKKLHFICEEDKDHFAYPIISELGSKIVKIGYMPKIRLLFYTIFSKNIWVEWATEYAIFFSQIKRSNQKLIVRLHRYEMYKKRYLRKIKWERIDKIIFVNRSLEMEFNSIKPNCKTVTIPNAIDINEFPLTSRTHDNTLLAYGFQFDPIKAYDKLITFFAKLLAQDDSFYLTIAGKTPGHDFHKTYMDTCFDTIKKWDIEKYVKIQQLDIEVSEIRDHKNIIDLLSANNGIMSFSDEESFHYAFAEGLTSGLQGFCRGWRRLDPYQFWNNWCYENEEAMIEGLMQWSQLNKTMRNSIGKSNRDYVKKRYSAKIIAERFYNLFQIQADA